MNLKKSSVDVGTATSFHDMQTVRPLSFHSEMNWTLEQQPIVKKNPVSNKVQILKLEINSVLCGDKDNNDSSNNIDSTME